MKSLNQIIESLLDADFDITDKDLTLAQAGWYVERADASEHMMTQMNKQRISELNGLKCNQISGDSPWKDFEEIGDKNRIKCTCRSRWNNLKYVFAHWLLALMKTARGDAKSINDTILDIINEYYRDDYVPVTVTERGGKLYIKGEYVFKGYVYRGHKAKLNITLSQRTPENRVRFYK